MSAAFRLQTPECQEPQHAAILSMTRERVTKPLQPIQYWPKWRYCCLQKNHTARHAAEPSCSKCKGFEPIAQPVKIVDPVSPGPASREPSVSQKELFRLYHCA